MVAVGTRIDNHQTVPAIPALPQQLFCSTGGGWDNIFSCTSSAAHVFVGVVLSILVVSVEWTVVSIAFSTPNLATMI